MREILFRGKRESDGKWIYGYYSDDKVHGTDFPCIFPFVEYEDDGDWAVFPETVGQYTGLTDKNGKPIFEGDIVHCTSQMDSSNMFVTFEDGEFRLILCEDYKKYKEKCFGFYSIRCFLKEVIGNVHNNPELLKEGE